MRKHVTLYTTPFCPFCIRAIKKLKEKEVDFTNIDVSKDRELFKKISLQTGWDTVPQIFIGETFIGGCDDLHALDAAGKLDELLEA